MEKTNKNKKRQSKQPKKKKLATNKNRFCCFKFLLKTDQYNKNISRKKKANSILLNSIKDSFIDANVIISCVLISYKYKSFVDRIIKTLTIYSPLNQINIALSKPNISGKGDFEMIKLKK